jgi:hypothetical protein
MRRRTRHFADTSLRREFKGFAAEMRAPAVVAAGVSGRPRAMQEARHPRLGPMENRGGMDP